MNNVYESKHPLLQHAVGMLRDKNTPNHVFRELVYSITNIIGIEATAMLPTKDVEIETPLIKCKQKQIDANIGIIPILRAGLGMEAAMSDLIPCAHTYHVGLERKEDLQPREYYCKLPKDSSDLFAIIVDPMLATGGSALATIKLLKERGCKKIMLLTLISAPEGINLIHSKYPEIKIFTGAVDSGIEAGKRGLNEKGYIVPGLGDAGDRIFGTNH